MARVRATKTKTGVKIKNKYKLHSMSVAQGVGYSAGNDVFYETMEDAEAQAIEYVESDPNCRGIVIYKAVKVVRHRVRPIRVEDVED